MTKLLGGSEIRHVKHPVECLVHSSNALRQQRELHLTLLPLPHNTPVRFQLQQILLCVSRVTESFLFPTFPLVSYETRKSSHFVYTE